MVNNISSSIDMSKAISDFFVARYDDIASKNVVETFFTLNIF